MTKGEVFVLNRDDEWGHLILDFDDLPGSSTENDEYSVDYVEKKRCVVVEKFTHIVYNIHKIVNYLIKRQNLRESSTMQNQHNLFYTEELHFANDYTFPDEREA